MKPISPPNFPDIDQNGEIEVIFQDIVDPTKKVKRTGFCNRCGQCCEDSENIFRTEDGDGNPISQPLEQVVPGKCAYFRWSEDGLAICTGRDTKYYKNGCRFWPSKPGIIYDKCGYRFEWITD